MAEAPTCPLCAGTASALAYTVGTFSIRRCAGCSHGFVAPMPSDQDLRRLYQASDDSLYANGVANQVAEYLDGDPDRFRTYYRDRLAAVRRTGVGTDGRVLDFGCTNGAFVTALTRNGFSRALGFDIARDLVAQGRERWGADLHTGPLDEFLGNEADGFEVVHAVNVFEHLPNPRQVLEALSTRLRHPGGVVLTVPNAAALQVRLLGRRSPVIAPPHHLQYFTPRSLGGMVESLGFRVVSVETPFWSTEADTYLAMLGVPRWGAAGLRHVARLPGLALERLGWGGIITLVAVRPQ